MRITINLDTEQSWAFSQILKRPFLSISPQSVVAKALFLMGLRLELRGIENNPEAGESPGIAAAARNAVEGRAVLVGSKAHKKRTRILGEREPNRKGVKK